jgi:hypothetical protein
VDAHRDDELAELPDRWLLPYRGMRVTQIRIDQSLTFVLDGRACIVVGCPAMLTHGSARAPGVQPVFLNPGQQDVAPALALFGATVHSRVAFKNGTLRVVCGGIHLTVRPDPELEAWNTSGPGDLRVVCAPGGGLAVWR